MGTGLGSEKDLSMPFLCQFCPIRCTQNSELRVGPMQEKRQTLGGVQETANRIVVSLNTTWEEEERKDFKVFVLEKKCLGYAMSAFSELLKVS